MTRSTRKWWSGMGLVICMAVMGVAMVSLFDEQQTQSGKCWAGFMFLAALTAGCLLYQDMGVADRRIKCEAEGCDMDATHRCTANPLVPAFLNPGVMQVDCKLCASCAADYRQQVHELGHYHPLVTQRLTDAERMEPEESPG